jgi:quinol monooxygenase YgiN
MIMLESSSPAQTSQAVYVATYVDVQLSSTNEGLVIIQQYRKASRAETGNAGVDVVQEIGRPNRFVIVEVWKDRSSFESHQQAEHTVQFRTRLKAIHNSPYDQRVHQGFAIDPRPLASKPDMWFVVTHVDVPPPRRDATEALLKRLAEESRNDGGNVRYDVFQQAPQTNHFTVFAVWNNRKAFDSHEAKADTRQFREALGPMLGAPYDERLYRPVN